MSDREYLNTLKAAAEGGDEQAAAVLRMLETRFPKLWSECDQEPNTPSA